MKTFGNRLILHPILSMGLILLCTACSSTDPDWRAPVETRSLTSPIANHPTSNQIRHKPGPKSLPISASDRFYIIQPGDTLFSIAWRSENPVDTLAAWNKLKSPYRIYPGQRLRLFAPAKSITPKPPEPVTIKPDRPQKPNTPPPTTPLTKKPPVQVGKLNWRWPLRGKLAATYQAGDPLRKGIKISGKPGAMIRASESGRVIYSGDGLIGYGLLLIIKHNDKYLSAYGHNRKLRVKKGQQVAKGDKIAELGTTNAGKSQLHFEIRYAGKPVNPLGLLPE